MAVVGGSTGLFGENLDDVEYVGRGGAGTVYRARDAVLARTVAVKVLRGGLHPDSGGPSLEAKAQAAVSWHANVLSLYGSGVTPDGSPYLVLEYATGGNLREKVAASGPLDYDAWLRMARELAAALAAAHGAGVIHCDVKPSNVLFAADGSVRLADFGIARSTDATTSTLDHFEGSLAFAPPELLEGQRPQPANDVYGLALTLWFAATGRQPFGADHLSPNAVIARIHSERLSFGDVIPEAPRELRAILDRALSGSPMDRPGSSELVAHLGAQGSEEIGGARRGKAGPRGNRASRIAAMALVGALVSTVLAVGTMTKRPESGHRAGFCSVYASALRKRVALFNAVSADLEQTPNPRDVVEALLIRYPVEAARIVQPAIDAAGRQSAAVSEVTESQIADLARADVFRALGGGKAFVYDGESGAFSPGALPGELRIPAEAFSKANEIARTNCPAGPDEVGPAKARMYSAIISNLGNPGFMKGFFSDPRSPDLFDTSLVLLMCTLARNFFEMLLTDHWSWFFELLNSNPEMRTAVAVEHPDIILDGTMAEPELMDWLKRPEWAQDLTLGIQRSGLAARKGMAELFPEQFELVGIR